MRIRLFSEICLCVISVILLLSACGRQQTISESEISANEVEPISAEDSLPHSNNMDSNNMDNDNIEETYIGSSTHGFSFTYNGQTIYMGMSPEIIESLGEYINTFDSSAIEEFYIPEFQYPGFDIDVFYSDMNSEHEPKVIRVILKNDKVATDEGLKIGDSANKIKQIYGNECKQLDNNYIYTKGDSDLKITISNDIVTKIIYRYNDPDYDQY